MEYPRQADKNRNGKSKRAVNGEWGQENGRQGMGIGKGKALRLLSLAGHNAVTCGIYWRHIAIYL